VVNPQSRANPVPSRAADPPPRYFEARADLAYRYLAGKGLEIGALNWPLELPAAAERSTVDRMTLAELREEYPELRDQDLSEVDVIDDGEKLETIAEGSQDFIIANHFLEHTGDPIGTIRTHLGKLKPGGILFYAVPDKRYTFDFRRGLTPLEHVVRDHEEGPAGSRREHFDQWAHLVSDTGVEQDDPGFAERADQIARKLEAEDFSIHHHTWTAATFLELLLHCRHRFDEGFEIEATCRRELEFVAVLRKAGAYPEPAGSSAPVSTLLAEIERLQTHAGHLERDLNTTNRELSEVKRSPSWRITQPLRNAKALLARRR
jgi:predicted SAM-dependent methyltransferase